MSSSMGCQQDKQDGDTFCTLNKKKAKFMTILAFQEYSSLSPELALERAVTYTELSLTINTFVMPKHCSRLFSFQK